MEYVPLRRVSFCARLRLLLSDVLFVCQCVWRFALDHLINPYHPQPQACSNDCAHITPFYRLNKEQKNKFFAEQARCDANGQQQIPLQPSCAPSAEPAAQETSAAAPAGTAAHAAAPSASLAGPPSLRVLSLNFWGLPISPRVHERVQELAKVLHLYDLVALQELSHEREVVWLQAHCRRIGLVHQQVFRAGVGFPIWHGVTAPSLALFSRFPIVDVAFKRFSINGKMFKLGHSDYMGAKGVGLVRVDVSSLVYPDDGLDFSCRPLVGVDVFLSHVHANYSDFVYNVAAWQPWLADFERREQQQMLTTSADDSMPEPRLPADLPVPLMTDIGDEYVAHRVLQSFELARFIASHRRNDFLTLLCGDLNAPPYDLTIQIIQSLSLGQSAGCVPRLMDAFSELHPHSHGFTCGAADNSFTFSTQPLHMARIRMPLRMRQQQQQVQQCQCHTKATNGQSDSSQRGNANLQTPSRCLDDSPRSSCSDAGASPSTGPHRRKRFNSYPSASALVPSDSSLRAARSFGEHPQLLQINSSNTSSNDPKDASEAADGGAATNSPAKGIADEVSSVGARSPLAWVDEHSPKRIDFLFYAPPSARMHCACQWDRMQLPFHQTDREDDTNNVAATGNGRSASSPSAAMSDADDPSSSCSCSAHLQSLPAPRSLWHVTSSAIFKQYVQELGADDGCMMSISDHHGVSVTLTFQREDTPQAREDIERRKEEGRHAPSSTVIVTQHTALPASCSSSSSAAVAAVRPSAPSHLASTAAGSSVAGAAAAATSSTSSISLRPKPIIVNGEEVGVETELFTLADDEPTPPPPAVAPCARCMMPETACNGAAAAATSSDNFTAPLPPLSVSTLLLLLSGVLWLGLQDATDRRARHLRRMAHAFAVLAIGTQSLWIALFDAAFGSMVETYLLPVGFALPPLLSSLGAALLWLIDWAHALVPIYLVVEFLLTTFPAKEEQGAMRQALHEATTLRRFNINAQRRSRLREQARQKQTHTKALPVQ